MRKRQRPEVRVGPEFDGEVTLRRKSLKTLVNFVSFVSRRFVIPKTRLRRRFAARRTFHANRRQPVEA
jgi:hypothetical protein